MVTQNIWKEITNIMRHMLNPLDFSLEETDNLLRKTVPDTHTCVTERN